MFFLDFIISSRDKKRTIVKESPSSWSW